MSIARFDRLNLLINAYVYYHTRGVSRNFACNTEQKKLGVNCNNMRGAIVTLVIIQSTWSLYLVLEKAAEVKLCYKIAAK